MHNQLYHRGHRHPDTTSHSHSVSGICLDLQGAGTDSILGYISTEKMQGSMDLKLKALKVPCMAGSRPHSHSEM